MSATPLQSSYSRVFLLPGRASPTNKPRYSALVRSAAATWDQGKNTNIFLPDPQQYGKFNVVGKIQGEPGLPQIVLDARFTTDLSDLLKAVAGGCDNDVQLHFGACKNASDFNGGWVDGKVLVLEAARASSWKTNDLGAFEPGQSVSVVETANFDGQTLYEIKPLTFAEKAAAQINDEILDIVVCGSPSCGGVCGPSSDGCQTVFALSDSSEGSPGLLATVLYTKDGGNTWGASPITTLAANSAPSAIVCVGLNVVVLSEADNALHYAPIADVLAGTETWTRVATGFVQGPNAVFSLGETTTYIVGDGGYIYLSDDPTGGVTVVDAGSATVQNLLAIDAADLDNLIAVGVSNAVVVSVDGGVTWETITGPAAGVTLTACAMISNNEFWVAGGGNLYYTQNGGTTWATKPFSGSGSGTIGDINFVTPTVGYIAHTTTAPKGRLLRTIDGGHSWYVLPEGNSTMPSNHGLNAIATCGDANIVFAGGLATNGVDGIIVAGK